MIVVENLSKSYLVGHQSTLHGPRNKDTLREVILRELPGAARKARDIARGRHIVQGDEIEEFWALKGVSS